MHHGIATAIASDFLNRRRNRKEFPQWGANLAIFHRKMHRNRNRIDTAEKSQPIPQKESLRAIWPCKRKSRTSTANHRRETVHTYIATELSAVAFFVRKGPLGGRESSWLYRGGVRECFLRVPWKLKPGFINRVLVAVIFEASKCL